MPIGALVATPGGTNFTTVSPNTFTMNPATPARALWISVVHNAASGATVTSVDVGGVALTLIERAIDAAGEIGTAEHWFIGSGIPTGLQTISIFHGGAATTKRPVGFAYAADADTEVVVFGKLEGDQANPQIALDSGAVEAIRVCAIFSGLNAPTDLTILSGMTAVTTFDFGVTSTRVDRQTSNSTGSYTIGYTGASDDVAMVAAAIQQVAGATENPYPYVGGGYYPTEG